MIASTQTNHPIPRRGGHDDDISVVEASCKRLKQVGMRITQPRTTLISVLAKHYHPVSIDQLHQSMDRKVCDLVTVYRCLAAFEEVGLVKRSFSHNGTSLYRLIRQGGRKFHVTCKTSNRIEELDSETNAELDQIVHKAEQLLKAKGYTGVSHILEFFGHMMPESHHARKSEQVQIVAEE